MPEYPLDDLDPLALCDQITAACVSQLMRCVAGSTGRIEQPCRGTKLCPLIVQGVVGDPGATIGVKLQLVIGRCSPLCTSCSAQGAQRARGRDRAEDDCAFDAVFGFPNAERF